MFSESCYATAFLLFQLNAWIGCCVAFGGALVSFNFGGASVTGYWDHIRFGGVSYSWDTAETLVGSDADCAGAGKGLVALLVIAFITLTLTLVVTTVRLLGRHSSFPGAFSSTFAVLVVEVALSLISSALYFIGVAEWGGACVTKINDANGVSNLQLTGFAYVIVCLLLLVLSLPIGVIAIFKARPAVPTGLGSSSSAGSEGHYAAPSDNTKTGAYDSLSSDGQNYGSYQSIDEKHDDVPVQTH